VVGRTWTYQSSSFLSRIYLEQLFSSSHIFSYVPCGVAVILIILLDLKAALCFSSRWHRLSCPLFEMAATIFPSIQAPSLGSTMGALFLGVVGAAMYVSAFISPNHGALRLDYVQTLWYYKCSDLLLRQKISGGSDMAKVCRCFSLVRRIRWRWNGTWRCGRIMDTLHTAFIVDDLWHYLVQSFGNYQALLPITW